MTFKCLNKLLSILSLCNIRVMVEQNVRYGECTQSVDS